MTQNKRFAVATADKSVSGKSARKVKSLSEDPAKTEQTKLEHRWSIAGVWIIAAVIAGLPLGVAELRDPTFLVAAIGAVFLTAGALQLITADKNGFIVRFSLSIAGAVLLLGISVLLTWFLR